MSSRWIFFAITAFWGVMNVLLWRSEMQGGAASNVPMVQVVQRVLDAADSSTLLIRHHGKSIGQVRWTPSILQDAASATHPLVDEGMVNQATGYAVDLDINLTGVSAALRGRGVGRCELNANRSWRSLEFRFTQKPLTYAVSVSAGNPAVRLRVERGQEILLEQSFPLQDPAALLTQLDGALGGFGLVSPGMLSGLGLMSGISPTNTAPMELPSNLLKWESRTAELHVSQQRVRTFQITGRWLNRYQGDVWIGRGGEILRMVLPDEIELRDHSLPAER